ncbi:MAG: hypothetical protein IJW55_01575 [Clostridia bacterium]|nr:hypothetical protein [Clostridia bacterium]
MELKTVIFWFVAVSVTASLLSIAYVLIDWLAEKREDTVPARRRRVRRRRRRSKREGASVPVGALFGIGALSALGHLLLAHRINKLSDNLEERRKWK